MPRHRVLAALAFAVFGGLCSFAAFSQSQTPPVKTNPLRDAYYGDLHLHTSSSFDAYLFGPRTVAPDDAYRFAKGEVVDYLGKPVQRREPLDFLAVTDHAENLGAFNELEDPDSPLARSESGKAFRRLQATIAAKGREGLGDSHSFIEMYWDYFLGSRNKLPEAFKSPSAWTRVIEAANRHYQPGRFTTFIAYEWTSFAYGGNLHRNVVFKGSSAPYPFSAFDSKRVEDLWAWMEEVRNNGFEALAIPHNSNGSNGFMYDWMNSDSQPITSNYAVARLANEPLGEIGQAKGNSETHPLLSPNDEFSRHEIFDFMAGWRQSRPVEGSYLRDGLSRGLVLRRKLGVNPYKYGFAGGSDIHSGLSVGAQADFGGSDTIANLGGGRASPAEAKSRLNDPYLVRLSPGYLTGVWAESNTRDAIYDALRRKEVFATSGTRLKFRFFGGWNFKGLNMRVPNWESSAYSQGVPMGGALQARPHEFTAPTFLIWAVKDPNGANLDRVQVIKVWEADGQQREKVFDVAWSDNRRLDPKTGKLTPAGNTVDLATGRYANTIGATELSAVWKDPEFDPERFAAYYLRVLEIPTPRWSTLLASQHGLPLPKDVPASSQQRGWSSPIWYEPATK